MKVREVIEIKILEILLLISVFFICITKNLTAQVADNNDKIGSTRPDWKDLTYIQLWWDNNPIEFVNNDGHVTVKFRGDVWARNPEAASDPDGGHNHMVALYMEYTWGNNGSTYIVEKSFYPVASYYGPALISLYKKENAKKEDDILTIKNPVIKFGPISQSEGIRDLRVRIYPAAIVSAGTQGFTINKNSFTGPRWYFKPGEYYFESILKDVISVDPVLKLNKTTLDFGVDKDTLTFEVSNEGGNGLDWKAEKNKDWIVKIEPNHNENQMSTDGPVTVTVTVDRSKMPQGKCHDTGTITVTNYYNFHKKYITVKIRKAPATPSNLHITNTTGKPHLDWNDAYLADHYTVERKPQTGTFSVIATNITSSEYTDQEVIMMGQGPGTEIFTYRVKAYNEYNDPSDYSNTADTPTEGVSPDGRQIGFDDRIIQSNVPDEYGLSQNYPNPANPSTTIIFQTLRDGHVLLRIFNLQGRLVRTLVDGNIKAGFHKVLWDGRDSSGRSLSSGIYIYRLDVAGKVFVKKLTLMK